MKGNRNIISISGTVACNQVSNEVLMQNNLKRIKMSTNLKRIHHSRSYKWIYYHEVFFNVILKQNSSYFMLLKECFGCKWNKYQLFIIYFTRNAIIFITKGDRFIKPPHSESIPKFFLEIPEPMIIQKSWEKVRKNDLFSSGQIRMTFWETDLKGNWLFSIQSGTGEEKSSATSDQQIECCSLRRSQNFFFASLLDIIKLLDIKRCSNMKFLPNFWKSANRQERDPSYAVQVWTVA